MNMFKIGKYLFVLLIPVLANTAFANKSQNEVKGLSWNENEPLNISSDTMEFVPDKNEIVFTGRVNIKQSTFVLTAEKMTVTKGREEFVLNASGNVKIEHNEWYAQSDLLQYKSSDKVFVFSGNPLVKNKGNVVKGKLIRYYSESNRIVVDSPETTMIISDLKKKSASDKAKN